MDTVLFIVLFIAAFALIHVIDNKYNVRVNDWLNGVVTSPFSNAQLHTAHSESSHVKNETANEIEALKERVATLEKIVTDNRYELDEKLRKL